MVKGSGSPRSSETRRSRFIYRHSQPLSAPKGGIDGAGFYPPLNQRTYVEDGIRVDQDVPVKLRDGATIYLDIYRPDGPEGVSNLPAIVAWGCYGKRPGDSPNKDWNIYGVPPDTVSKMTKFEGPDPAYWCRHGYAVINVDSRGSGNSEGNLQALGHAGRRRRSRRGRVAGRAGVVQRQGEDVRQLGAGDVPVVRRGRAAAAPHLHRRLGGHRGPLPGVRHRQRDPRTRVQRLRDEHQRAVPATSRTTWGCSRSIR